MKKFEFTEFLTYAHTHPDIYSKPIFWTFHTILNVLRWKSHFFFMETKLSLWGSQIKFTCFFLILSCCKFNFLSFCPIFWFNTRVLNKQGKNDRRTKKNFQLRLRFWAIMSRKILLNYFGKFRHYSICLSASAYNDCDLHLEIVRTANANSRYETASTFLARNKNINRLL